MSRIIRTSMFALALALSSSALAEAKTLSPASVEMNEQQKILVDGKGRSLYTFDKDQSGKSECTLLCAVAWPPLVAPVSAKAFGQWTVTTRPSGVMQWVYKGSPLYTYRFDSKRGDIRGDGAEGVWHLARP